MVTFHRFARISGYLKYPVSGRISGHQIRYPAGYPAIKSGIRPDTVSLKRPDYPAGYPVHPYYGLTSPLRPGSGMCTCGGL
jgi:hypothetical protein